MDSRRAEMEYARAYAERMLESTDDEEMVAMAEYVTCLAMDLTDTLDREARLREVARAGKAYDDAFGAAIESDEAANNLDRLHDEYRTALDNLQPGDV